MYITNIVFVYNFPGGWYSHERLFYFYIIQILYVMEITMEILIASISS